MNGAVLAGLMSLATVWYVPGWKRCGDPDGAAMAHAVATFPDATVEYCDWDGNKSWKKSFANADSFAVDLADKIEAMPEEERASLVLVGHSMGGRIVVRTMAILADRGVYIQQGIVMAAAIPRDDPDVAKFAQAGLSRSISLCNPDDTVLKRFYTLSKDGWREGALGAEGTATNVENLVEYEVPQTITRDVSIDETWAKVQWFKDVANHYAPFYLGFLRTLMTEGQEP